MKTLNLPPQHHDQILNLHRQGLTQTQIAQATGLSRRTVYNHIHQRVFKPGHLRGRPKGSPKLAPFLNLVHAKLQAKPHGSMAKLWAELRPLGYTGAGWLNPRFIPTRHRSK
jgi:transposase